ncbi:MAG: hypothetical protein IT168_05035 [Bryobacterales bacterium]|nr:hypothetical protein [Bryobacterales bacterium]
MTNKTEIEYEYRANAGPSKEGCFERLTSEEFRVSKKTHPNHKIVIKSDKPMSFSYKVEEAQFRESGNQWVNVNDVTQIHPFKDLNPHGQCSAASPKVHEIADDMGLWAVAKQQQPSLTKDLGGRVKVKIEPDNPCTPHEPVYRSHTDWHIEC